MVITKTGATGEPEVYVTGFEIPLGFKTVNATPLDVWSGPYSGDTLNEARQIALSAIPIGVRYLTMQVRFVSKDKGVSVYWFKNGVSDEDLIIYEPNSDAVKTLYSLITGETNQRIIEDNNLFDLITGETLNRINNDNDILVIISGESISRIDKDNELFNLITGETASRISGYTDLYNIVTGQTQALINEEIFNRTTGDTLLYSLYTGETNERIVNDSLILDLSTGYTYQVQTGLTSLIDNLYNIKFDITGGTISGDLLVTGGTISGDGIGIFNIQISGITGLKDLLDSKSESGHTHFQLFQPDGNNPFVYTDNDGVLHVNGNIIQSGSTYEIHSNKIFTTADTITLRDGAVNSLSTGSYVGLIAKLYDGINDGVLVFDKNGVARVGDMNTSLWTGTTQAIATREDSPINGGLAIWNSSTNRFDTINPIDLPVSNIVNSLITGETSNRISQDNLLHDLITGETANRISADISLNTLINNETVNRITGDTALNAAITGETASRISGDAALNAEITGLTNNIINNYVPYTGSSKNINLGNYNITANTLTSTVTGLTPAIKVSNTTKIDNLNADMLDNIHASGFTSIDKFNIHTGNTNVHLVPNFTTAGTNTKITYSSNGLVISGSPATYDTLISDSVTSVAVGGAQSGITASVWKNKTIIEVLDNILFPDILPTYTIPTILITSNLSGLFEIGSTISQNLTLTGTKNDAGSFTSLNITRNGGVVSIINNPIGNAATNVSPQFGFNDPNNPNLYYSLSYIDTMIVSGGTTTWIGHGDYLSGLTKQNNKGVYDTRTFLIRDINAPQASSTNFSSSSKTINGVYPYYFGKSLSSISPSDVVNIIQTGAASSALSTNSGGGSLSINYSANGEWIWFATINTVPTKTNWYENALNNGSIGGSTDLISSPTILQVNSPNGYWNNVSYKIYVAQKVTTIGTCVIS